MHHRIGPNGGRKCKKLLYTTILGLLVFAFFDYGLSQADKEKNDTWSFRFDKMPISEVLRELSETANVEIFTNRSPGNKVVTKTYTNQSIAQIIRDVFKDVSFALVWYYSEEGLDGVGVWLFDKNKGGYSGTLTNIEERSLRNRANTRAFRDKRQHQERQPDENEDQDYQDDEQWAEDAEMEEELTEPISDEKEGLDDVSEDQE